VSEWSPVMAGVEYGWYLPSGQARQLYPSRNWPAVQAGYGVAVGFLVGVAVGFLVGEEVGALVGEEVGPLVGELVGPLVGEEVGALVGDEVGVLVGASVGTFRHSVRPGKPSVHSSNAHSSQSE
jgi:phage tail tape-measure protein